MIPNKHTYRILINSLMVYEEALIDAGNDRASVISLLRPIESWLKSQLEASEPPEPEA